MNVSGCDETRRVRRLAEFSLALAVTLHTDDAMEVNATLAGLMALSAGEASDLGQGDGFAVATVATPMKTLVIGDGSPGGYSPPPPLPPALHAPPPPLPPGPQGG